MRGYLAAYASVGWGGGRFVSTGVLRGTLGMKGDWAWRLPYAIQWIWPVPLAALVVFAPESESVLHLHAGYRSPSFCSYRRPR